MTKGLARQAAEALAAGNAPVAADRDPEGACQRSTPGCSVDHRPGTDHGCQPW